MQSFEQAKNNLRDAGINIRGMNEDQFVDIYFRRKFLFGSLLARHNLNHDDLDQMYELSKKYGIENEVNVAISALFNNKTRDPSCYQSIYIMYNDMYVFKLKNEEDVTSEVSLIFNVDLFRKTAKLTHRFTNVFMGTLVGSVVGLGAYFLTNGIFS